MKKNIKICMVIIVLASSPVLNAFYNYNDSRWFGPERDAVYNTTVGNVGRMGNWLQERSQPLGGFTRLVGIGTLFYLTGRCLWELSKYAAIRSEIADAERRINTRFEENRATYKDMAQGSERNTLVDKMRQKTANANREDYRSVEELEKEAHNQVVKTAKMFALPIAAVASWYIYAKNCTMEGRNWYNAELVGMIIAAIAAIKAPDVLKRFSLSNLVKRFRSWQKELWNRKKIVFKP